MDSNNSNNNIGSIMRSQGYYVPDPQEPSPMTTQPVQIPIPVGMKPPFSADEDMLSREEKSDIPTLADGIKNSVETSYHDDVRARNNLLQTINERGIPKGNYDVTGSRISLQDSRYRLSSGKWIPKYESYINGLDNDDRLSKTQSTWEKTYRGIGKLAYKTALYGVGGVAQSVYGLKELVTKGSLNAMYNNDFTNWLDDMDKKGDYTLNHYYSKEERDAGFLKSMKHANFWTNDLLSGVSFTLGAMLSSYITGGAGMMNFARYGAKAGAIMNGLGKAGSATKVGFNAMLRGARTGRAVGKAMDTAVFLGTSTAWEAAVESKSMEKEAEDNYRQSYRNLYGREPSYEELMAFRADASDAANKVFGANVAILSLSNTAMFGEMFGLELGVDKALKKKMFGIDVTREANGNIKAITPKTWQKVGGYAYNISKRPISEGLYEEGTQGVASTSAKDWIESRYNPMALKQNIGYMEAVKNGFKETYGTSQGWKEIGIGMIIGSVMGGKTIGGIREWSSDIRTRDKMVADYNQVNSTLTEASKRAIKGSMMLNAQLASINGGPTLPGEGSSDVIVGRSLGDAIFKRLWYENEMGLLSDTKENFRTVIESIQDSDIAADMGMTSDQVSEYKKSLIDEFNKRVDSFTKANRLGEMLTDGISNPTFKEYITEMAYNGLDARDNMERIYSRISSIQGESTGRALDVFSHLRPNSKTLLDEVDKINAKIAGIEKEILKAQAELTTSENREAKQRELQEKNNKMLKLTEEKADMERKLSMMVNSEVDVFPMSPLNFGRTITVDEMMAANEAVKDLERSLTVAGREANSEVLSLLAEYRNSLAAYRNINDSLARMRDKRFMAAQERGFTKMLANMWDRTYKEDNEKLDFINTDNPRSNAIYKNDQAIDTALEEGKISEDEAFMFKTYNHMIARAVNDEVDTDATTQVENVPDEEVVNPSDDRLYDIAVKVWNGNDDMLSPNEKAIYDNNKKRMENEIFPRLGDSPMGRLKRNKERIEKLSNKVSDPIESNRTIIDDIIDSGKSRAEKDAVQKAIDTYNDLMDKKEAGEDINEDELADARDAIENYSEIPLLPFVNQERLLKQGDATPRTKGDFFNIKYLLTESEPGVSTGKTEAGAAQNPVIAASRIVERDGGMYFEVAGIRADRAFEGIDMEREDAETGDGEMITTFTPKEGSVMSPFSIFHGGDVHARWRVPVDEIEALEKATGIVLDGLTASGPTDWFMVYRRGEDGSYAPYYTSDTFGSGNESIDQQAVLEARKGDKMTLKVEMNDPYTKALYDSYKTVLDDPNSSEEDRAEAKDNLMRGMVIKIYDSKGRFVSVLKATEAGDKGAASGARATAVDMYLNNAGTDIVLELPYTAEVRTPLPGRPNFTIERGTDGDLFVKHEHVSDEAAKRVESIGYMLDGKIHLRDDIKYSTFPFMTKAIKNKGLFAGEMIPVVAFKASNGITYIYPVMTESQSQGGALSSGSNMAKNMAERMKQGDIPSLQEIAELNKVIAKSGIGSEYIIPISGDIAMIAAKADNAAEALSGVEGMVDVANWLDESRDMDEILKNEVLINIDLAGDPLVAPRLKISIKSNEAGVNEALPDVDTEESAEEEAEDGEIQDSAIKNAEDTAAIESHEPEAVSEDEVEPGDSYKENSVLYEEAIRKFGDEDTALKVFQTAYSDEFLEYFGDWINNPSEYNLSESGEPKLDDVMAFMKMKNFAAGNFTAKEVIGLNNAMMATGVEDITELSKTISDNFLVDGDIFLNKENLVASGLYTIEEISRILSDAKVMKSVKDMMRRIVDYAGSVTDMNGRDAHFLSVPQVSQDDIVYSTGFDILGKRNIVNPAEVEETLKQYLGGIREREMFDEAVRSLPYQSVVERYNSDDLYAAELFDAYSKMTRAAVVDENGNPVKDPKGKVVGFVRSNPGVTEKVRAGITDIINMSDDDISNVDTLYKKIKKLALDAAGIGIDLSDLANKNLLRGKEEKVRQLMASLDVALASMDDADIEAFANELYEFAGISPSSMEVIDREYDSDDTIVFSRTGTLSPREMFDRGLLYLKRNVFHRTGRITDFAAVYSDLADIIMTDPYALPIKMPRDVSGMTKDKVIEEIRNFVLGYARPDNTEEMILTRLIYDHSVRPEIETADVNREAARYSMLAGRQIDVQRTADRIRMAYITEKIKNSELYRNALRFLSFSGNGVISLTNSDPVTLKNIEMALRESGIREDLLNYSLVSNDESMRNLFYIEPQSFDPTNIGFRRWLYRNYPDMLYNAKEAGVNEFNKDLVFPNMYDNFALFESGLYEKVGESKTGGIYRFIENVAYSDAGGIRDLSVKPVAPMVSHDTESTLSPVAKTPGVDKEVNEYTRHNSELKDDHIC